MPDLVRDGESGRLVPPDDPNALAAGIIAVLIGAALVFFVFPKRDREREVLVGYHQQDMAAMAE